MMKNSIISVTVLVLLFFAVGFMITAPVWAEGQTSLKCWKCGTVFEADSSQTLVRCPNCNAKCMVPKSAPASSESAEAADSGTGDAQEAITWQEAMNRKGRTVVVEAKIVNVYDPDAKGKKGPVKLNVDRNWKTSLTFVLFNRNGKFGNPSRFRNKTVRVRGTVGEYKGATQIKVENASDITIIEPGQASEIKEAPAIEDAAAPGEDVGIEEVAEYIGEDTAEVAAEEAPMTAESGKSALTWEEALNHLGDEVTVEATIVNVYDPASRGKGGPAKLNTDRDYRSSLTFVYYQKDKSGGSSGFGSPNSYLNKKVRVTGTVAEYKGSKQIMLRNPDQISIVQ